MRDRKQRYPLRSILNTEIHQQRIMTNAWKRVTSRYAPHVAPHNIGHIVYANNRKSEPPYIDGDILPGYILPPVYDCPSKTTSVQCITSSPYSSIVVIHNHIVIYLKLKCGCRILLGYNFHDFISKMIVNINSLTNHITNYAWLHT